MTDEKLTYMAKKGQLEKEIADLKLDIKRYQINSLLFTYDDNESKIKLKKRERDALRSAMDIEQLEDEIAGLEEGICRKWPELSEEWQQLSQDHFAYLNYLKQNKEGLKKDIRNLSEKMEQLAVNIRTFENDKSDYLDWKNKLASRFNSLQLEVPQVLLEELEEKYNILIGRIEEKEGQLKDTEEGLDRLKRKIIDEEYRQKDINRDVESLEELYLKRQGEEERLFQKIVTALQLDRYKEVYRPEWLSKQQQRIAELIEEKKERKIELQQELWEKNIDLSLNKEDYWLANKDIVYLKEEIGQLGISVESGAAFLQSIDEKERERLLKDYPLLAYSLVILQEKDWQIIDENIDPDILIHSPVPIYIRSRMNRLYQAGFKTVRGKAHSLVLDRVTLDDWRGKLIQESERLKGSVMSLDKSIEDLRKLNDNIISELEKETSANIKKELDELKEEAAESERLLLGLREESDDKKQAIAQLEKDLNDLNKSLDELAADLDLIREFIEEGDRLNNREKAVEQERQALDNFHRQRDEKEAELDRINQQQTDAVLDYRDWKRILQDELNRIRVVIDDAHLEEVTPAGLSRIERPDYRKTTDNEIYTLLD